LHAGRVADGTEEAATPERHERSAIAVLADAVEEAGWPEDPSAIPTGRFKREVWDVWNLDVWGNDEEGFDINDRRRVGSISIPVRELVTGTDLHRHQMTKRAAFPKRTLHVVYMPVDESELWRRFQRKYLAPGIGLERVVWDHMNADYIEVGDKRTGQPLYHLVRREMTPGADRYIPSRYR